MLDWPTIAYGAAISAVLAVVVVYAASRRLTIAVSALIAAALGPAVSNTVLRATHAREFFTDAPFRLMPASWQDAGSGVLTFALAAAVLGLGPLADNARRTVVFSALAGLAAFLVDVYLY